MEPTSYALPSPRLRQLMVDLGLGLVIAVAVLLLLLCAGTEDQGFIYVDF